MALSKKKKKTTSLSQNFVIKHVIEDSDGHLRPLRPGDLDIDKHKGVSEAFMMIYEWAKRKDLNRQF